MARGGSIYERRLADGTVAYVLVWRVGGRQVKRTLRGSRREAEAALTAALAARDVGKGKTVDTDTFAHHAEAG